MEIRRIQGALSAWLENQRPLFLWLIWQINSKNTSTHICAKHFTRCWKIILPSIHCFSLISPPDKPINSHWVHVSWVFVTCPQRTLMKTPWHPEEEKLCVSKRKPCYNKLSKYCISYHPEAKRKRQCLHCVSSFLLPGWLSGHHPLKPYLGVTCANHIQTMVGFYKLGWGYSHPQKQGSLEWRGRRHHQFTHHTRHYWTNNGQ